MLFINEIDLRNYVLLKVVYVDNFFFIFNKIKGGLF